MGFSLSQRWKRQPTQTHQIGSDLASQAQSSWGRSGTRFQTEVRRPMCGYDRLEGKSNIHGAKRMIPFISRAKDQISKKCRVEYKAQTRLKTAQ